MGSTAPQSLAGSEPQATYLPWGTPELEVENLGCCQGGASPEGQSGNHTTGETLTWEKSVL